MQYRTAKAAALLGSGDPVRIAAGRELLEQNLTTQGIHDYERVGILVLLAELARSDGRLDEAEGRLREALQIAGPDGSGTNGEEEIRLAEILVERGGVDRLREAKALLDRRAGDPPLFVRSRYRLFVAQAGACVALGDPRGAAAWAEAALAAADATDSGLRNHPRLGLVDPDPDLRAWLHRVASTHD